VSLKARLPAIFSLLVLTLSTFAVGFTCGYKRGYGDGHANLKSQLSQLLRRNHVTTDDNRTN
jgi:hypothetical protein